MKPSLRSEVREGVLLGIWLVLVLAMLLAAAVYTLFRFLTHILRRLLFPPSPEADEPDQAGAEQEQWRVRQRT